MIISDLIGTAGVSLILLAYFCSTFKLMHSDSKLFYLLNLLGGGLACYASYLITYWPFVILEGVWTLVSLIGFIKIHLKNYTK